MCCCSGTSEKKDLEPKEEEVMENGNLKNVEPKKEIESKPDVLKNTEPKIAEQ